MRSFFTSTFFTSILISLTGVLLALLAAEIAVRLFFAPDRGRTWDDRPQRFYAADSSTTFQDFRHRRRKPENTFRIEVIGDSFTFGTEMQFQDTFPKQLERFFALRDEDDIAVEVINGGVPGFSTSHEVGFVERAVRRKTDLILLQVTLNDPQMKSYQPTGLLGEQPFGPYQPTGLARPLTEYSALARFALSRIHNTRTHEEYVSYYHSLFKHERAMKQFTYALSQISRAVKESESTLGAVLFPLFGLPLDDSYPFHDLHEKVMHLLSERSIPALDLYPAFAGIPLDRIQVIPREDFHPNEIGHRIAAEAILTWLEEAQLVPDELIPKRSYPQRIDIRLQDVS